MATESTEEHEKIFYRDIYFSVFFRGFRGNNFCLSVLKR